MGKQSKRKRSAIPDDYFSAGPIEMARFGKNVIGRSRATPEQHAAMQARLAERYPKVVEEIDALVLRIAQRVSRLPPERLLHRGWWEFAMTVIGLAGDVGDMEQGAAQRMIDYVQSVIASVLQSQ